MAKISDVVKLKSGYANFVHLKEDFEATQMNADRMAMYRPTKAHRAAFERICRGLYQPNDKKFYLLSGSYGTGKSHLCLMTANVLCRSSGDPEIAGFHGNYAKLDPEKAKLLKNIRKDGQYLVAICDYHSGRHFEDVVMKAVFDACKAKGLDAGVETEFDEAERQLADWEKRGDKGGIRNFYMDFGKALEAVVPGLTVDQLRAGLKNYDSDVLDKFHTAFKEMMGGVEFQARAGNLIPILRKLVKSQAFKERFKGLAIFFDEFGFTLEKAGYSKDILQGFMETICKNEPNVLFVGCIHKDFKSYADRFSKDDAAVMSARITQVDLLNEGIEEIIGAIVETEKDKDAWKKEIAPKTGIFDQLVPPCKSLDLFPWIDDVNRSRERVLEDIYGVHPMALSCLLTLSSEIGSDAFGPFIRVTNSYNGLRALAFDIGFFRKVCKNGMILPESIIRFKFTHSQKDIGKTISFEVSQERLSKVKTSFNEYFKALRDCQVSRPEFDPLLCSVLKIRKPKKMKPQSAVAYDWEALSQGIAALCNRYAEELGENAYAVFNAMTEFASYPPQNRCFYRERHSFQRLAGEWLSKFSQECRKPDFKLPGYLEKLNKKNGNGGNASDGAANRKPW